MKYFDINYDRLKKLKQTNFFNIIIIIIILIISLLLFSCFKYINKKISCYGIFNNNVLTIQINSDLSDIIKNGSTLFINNEEITYKILNFEEYQIIENNVLQTINLTIDKKLYQNEINKITFYYDKEKLIKFIFELFK